MEKWRIGSIPAALGALDGYATNFNNQQHVNFIGAQDNHVHELVYQDGRWNHNDLL